jgi:CIC family chloride channel protein
MTRHWLSDIRHRLADANSLLHLSALGVAAGFFSALVILLFRYVIETPAAFWMPDANAENFESLPQWLHFALPVGGAVIIGLFMKRMDFRNTRTGIVHVLTRLHSHDGHMPLKNALVQFFGGAFAMATGQSGGREGPAIHLGAAVNSLLGQRLLLPNNSIRMLVGCGTAAAIAASFNTPVAGVIFAMEVIMMEYTVAGFIPVMLATITATGMARVVYGNEDIFHLPVLTMNSLWEIPYIVLLGLVIGCAAALFMGILTASLRHLDKPALPRMAMAGIITGGCALLAPEVLGIGYDSLASNFNNQLGLNLLLALIAAKIIATAVSVGLGMPIGLIGPTLLIGASIGGVLGILGSSVFPELASNHSFYVLLGMGAMMGAVLNAPLAALMALLEFSNNTAMIFPGMLAITIATLTNSEIFKQRSAHQTVFQYFNILLPTDPFTLALQRTSVASIMQRSLIICQQQISPSDVEHLANAGQQWVVICDDKGKPALLVDYKTLASVLQNAKPDDSSGLYDLPQLELSGQAISELAIQATLKQAFNQMNKLHVDALFVSGYISGSASISLGPDNGIVTRNDIEAYYTTPLQH